MKLGDPELRDALKRRVLVRHQHDPETRVIDELGLAHGTSRIDIAVVNGQLHGIEIKSDRDRLVRLESQMAAYNAVLDRVTLVVGARHVEAALQAVPTWWGVMLAQVGPRGGIHFQSLQRARRNPAVEPLAVAELLWRDEALTLLEQLGAARGLSGARRAALYTRLAEVAPLVRLRAHVRERLRARTEWRFGSPRTSGDD